MLSGGHVDKLCHERPCVRGTSDHGGLPFVGQEVAQDMWCGGFDSVQVPDAGS